MKAVDAELMNGLDLLRVLKVTWRLMQKQQGRMHEVHALFEGGHKDLLLIQLKQTSISLL